ncbi:MAG: beta-N-acetylhexosaminidase [Verrucomicrobiota bacterium]
MMHSIIPQPSLIQEGSGCFALTAKTEIIADSRFRGVAHLLAERLRAGTGWSLRVRVKGSDSIRAYQIRIAYSPTIQKKESYRLSVRENLIQITAGDKGGAFYGIQSLLQLCPPAIYNAQPAFEVEWKIASTLIQDEPKFRWRGVMLDTVRHFYSVEYLKKFIDLISQLKLNVLHWHLTDDQGWRIEIKKYPLLTKIGSKRRESPRGHFLAKLGGDGVPVEGYYTQDQIRELVAYALERNVQILPEIEMPGHAQAAIAAYPFLGDSKTEVSCDWGVHTKLFNVQEKTIRFLKDVLKEVTELFPFDYVHIGGDEVVKKQWKEDAATQKRMKELGIVDEEALQNWFVREMALYLGARGKKAIGWEEILNDQLPENASVMSWLGKKAAAKAANMGREAVVCSHEAYYFDYAQSSKKLREPLTIRGTTNLQKVYRYQPIHRDLLKKNAHLILGVQAQLWTEYLKTPSQVEYMAFPRLCAVAEVAWNGEKRPPYSHFKKKLSAHFKRLDCQDVRYFTN